MLSMIANPVTALPVVYPRSGLSRSDLVLWPMTSVSAVRQMSGVEVIAEVGSIEARGFCSSRCSPRCATPRRR